MEDTDDMTPGGRRAPRQRGRSKCKGPGLGELGAFPGAAQRAWAEAQSGRNESEGPRCHLRAQLQ